MSGPSVAQPSTPMSSPKILTKLEMFSPRFWKKVYYGKFSPAVSVRLRGPAPQARCLYEPAGLRGTRSLRLSISHRHFRWTIQRVSARGRPVRPLVSSVRNSLFYNGLGCNCSLSRQHPPLNFLILNPDPVQFLRQDCNLTSG